MNKQICLHGNNSIRLYGNSDGKVFERTFTITEKISAGASVICYAAKYEGGSKGVLKEFYPASIPLAREADGQLYFPTSDESTKRLFQLMLKEYLDPYNLILSKKLEHTDEIATFVQPFEIYYGAGDDRAVKTAYVWTPEARLVTFEHLSDMIHQHPNVKPEHQLVQALYGIKSLTQCICELHCLSMLHLDIKPSNFGFIRRGNETLMQTISLFDIDTVCSVDDTVPMITGSLGYIEPEASYSPPDNQTDIYAIGASLFSAIIVTDETRENGFLYKDDYYDRIEDFVKESKLIQASSVNRNPKLTAALTKVLRRCLSKRAHRYKACEDLLEDLEEALFYLLPAELGQRMRSDERWVLQEAEGFLDSGLEIIQHHLYKYPLYRDLPANSDELPILLLGFGDFSQRFLDICLQIGQMPGKTVSATIIGSDSSEWNAYLSQRPELGDFFEIAGISHVDEGSYGTLRFIEVNGIGENAIMDTQLSKGKGKVAPYVFVDLGEDEDNLKMAQFYRQYNARPIHFAWRGDLPPHSTHGLLPLYVYEDTTASSLHTEMERMAFNAHLIWEKNLNIDFEKVREAFYDPYNHSSSVYNVLSLKYKLHSIGIELDDRSPSEAASEFADVIKDSTARKEELICAEHRRWVAEKLCAGWRCIRNLEECSNGTTQDRDNRRHVCIVKSRPEHGIAEHLWDAASSQELEALDELDRMSVELHQMFSRHAETARELHSLEECTRGIRSISERNLEVSLAFKEWFCCIKGIWNGQRDRSSNNIHLYKSLKSAFVDKARAMLSHDNMEVLSTQVAAFEAIFQPIYDSAKYRDWKLDDVNLIENIPFILTYAEDVEMVIPFDPEHPFSNVSAATLVNPAKIHYLAYVSTHNDFIALSDTLSKTMEYLRCKNLRASVDVAVVYTETLNLENSPQQPMLPHNSIVDRMRLLPCRSMQDAPDLFRQYLRSLEQANRLFSLENNKSRTSAVLQTSGVSSEYRNYTFDPAGMCFEEHGERMFTYIGKKAFLRVADVTAFQSIWGEEKAQPEFFEEHDALWQLYREKSAAWKEMCERLKCHARANDTIAIFKNSPKKENQSYHYSLPISCRSVMQRILHCLIECGMIDSDSGISSQRGTDTCLVSINNACEGLRPAFHALTAEPYKLEKDDLIRVTQTVPDVAVEVMFDNTYVEKVDFQSLDAKRYREICGSNGLLEKLSNEPGNLGLILNYWNNDGIVSFTYANAAVKRLMTLASNILEIHVYHKAKELGYFDDVMSGYEVIWKDTQNLRNEFDLVVTKGFRIMIVECSVTKNLRQENYFKLASLVQSLGIEITSVLVADTQEKSHHIVSPNADQQHCGKKRNLITIYDSEQIDHIGQVLMQIMEGTYENI